MFELTCPTCGKRVQGDDSLLGKYVACPGCNATLTTPHATSTAITDAPLLHSSNDGAFSDGLPPHEPAMLSVKMTMPHIVRRLWPLLAVVVVIATLVGLLVPAVQNVREAAARTQSVNNLKQVGLAALSFHDGNKRFPFNGTGPAVAQDPTTGSWMFQILPYIDQAALFAQPNANSGVQSFMCPGRGRPSVSTTGAWSDYCINARLNDPLGRPNAPDAKLIMKDITDGVSNTIFCGHGSVDPDLYSSKVAIAQSTDIFIGGQPATARHVTTNQRDMRGNRALTWGSSFPQGTIVATCDDTIRMIPYSFTGGSIRNGVADGGLGVLLTPNGGEKANWPDD